MRAFRFVRIGKDHVHHHGIVLMNALVLPREVADILHGFAEIKDFGQALRGKHLHEAVFAQLNDVGLGAAHIRRWIENLIVERLVFFRQGKAEFLQVGGARVNSEQIQYFHRGDIQTVRKRSGHSMAEKLCAEIVAAYNNEGGAYKRKEDMHKMAEANKAFAHFRF